MIRAATPADLDDVFRLLAARSRAAFGTSELRRDELAQTWHLAGTDRFVARERGLAGYAELDAARNVEIAAADPGVGDALLEAISERAALRSFTSLAAVVAREDEPFHALVSRARFAHQGDVLRMWRTLDGPVANPTWPLGLDLRRYTDGDGERVHALLDEAYGAWDEAYAPRPHDNWLAWMTEHDEFDPDLWFLVERDGELVACVLNWREHDGHGWVKDIVVSAGERGRGLGRRLLEHTFAAYAARGVQRVGLKVDAGNPTGAPALYANAGFATDRRYGIWTKSL
jgi:mycothiol synthase